MRDVFESLTPVRGHDQKSRPGPPGLVSTWPIKAGSVQEEWPGCIGSRTPQGLPRAGTVLCGCGARGSGSLCCPGSSLASQGRTGQAGRTPKEDEGWGSGWWGAGVTVGRTLLALGTHPRQTHVALAPATSWEQGRKDQGLVSFLFSWQGTLYRA